MLDIDRILDQLIGFGGFVADDEAAADRVELLDEDLVSGRVKGYTTLADSGREITREFCPDCGSPLFTRAEKCPDLVFLKAGCLDEAELIKPSCQTWTKCAIPWAHIDETLPCYPESQ